MKFIEKLFVILILITLLLKTLFNYEATLDLFLFSGFLAIIYFPLGFYFLGKSPLKNNYILSIFLGILYAICMAIFILGLFNGKDYNIVYYFNITVLIIVLLSFSFKARGNPNVYYVTQILRTVFLLIINIVPLFRGCL